MKLTVIHSHPVWLPATMTWLDNQVRFLPPEVESHIVCERTENLDRFAIPNIHSLDALPRWRRGIERTVVRLRVRRHSALLTDVIREVRGEILHSHFGNTGWANLVAARSTGIRHVVTFYGRDVSHLPRKRPIWHARYRKMFDLVDAVLCEGEIMAKSIADLGCPEEKLRVHRLGVRLERLPMRPRQYDPASGEPLRVLIAAQFREKKGIPYAIEALGEAARSISIEVTVIGDASRTRRDQEEKRAILDGVLRHRLSGKIRFLGMQPHAVMIHEAYRHHVFLSPSVMARDGDTEGGAAVGMIEMAATGMPVVATTHCDTPGVIESGVGGLLAPERDAPALARHLLWLAAHPGAWQDMVRAARRRIESEFDARLQGIRLAAIYHEIAGRRRKGEG